MTVSSTTNKQRTSGNGATTIFPASIKIFAETDIGVTILDSTTDSLVNTLILNDGGALGFTVTFDTEAETLSVTANTAPASGEDIQILRDLPITQETDFPRASKFPSVANENALDKNTMVVQDQQEQLDRSLKLPENSSATSSDLPLPSSRRALIWDAAEDGTIINSTNDPDQAQADAAASATAAATSETNAATSASNAATSETNAATSASNAATSETNAAQSATDAQAAVGAVKVSSNDTTAGDLEAKILSSGLVGLSTQNDGANETRTIDVPIASQAEAEAGTDNTKAMTPLRSAQAIAQLAVVSGWEFVSSITASNDATVAFTNMVDGFDYQYMLELILPASDAVTLDAELGIAGPTYRTTGYDGMGCRISSAGGSSGSPITTNIEMSVQTIGNVTDEGYRLGFLTLQSPAASGVKTTYLSDGDQHDSGTTLNKTWSGGVFATAEAHTAIQFLMSSGNVASGVIKQYRRSQS